MDNLKKIIDGFLTELDIKVDKKFILDSIINDVVATFNYDVIPISEKIVNNIVFEIDGRETKELLSEEIKNHLPSYKDKINNKLKQVYLVSYICDFYRELGYSDAESQKRRLIDEVLPYYLNILNEVSLLEGRTANFK